MGAAEQCRFGRPQPAPLPMEDAVATASHNLFVLCLIPCPSRMLPLALTGTQGVHAAEHRVAAVGARSAAGRVQKVSRAHCQRVGANFVAKAQMRTGQGWAACQSA
eukprot:356777-Chlamydomonas_euryale.AAC.7